MLDIVIHGGAIYDGTGTPPRTGDVAVRGGRVVAELGRLPHLAARRAFPAHDLWEVPEALVTFRADGRGPGRDEIVARLAAGDPAVEGYSSGAQGLLLCPATLEAGDAEMVVERIREVVAS